MLTLKIFVCSSFWGCCALVVFPLDAGWLGVTEEGWLLSTGCTGVCFVSTSFLFYFISILITRFLLSLHITFYRFLIFLNRIFFCYLFGCIIYTFITFIGFIFGYIFFLWFLFWCLFLWNNCFFFCFLHGCSLVVHYKQPTV